MRPDNSERYRTLLFDCSRGSQPTARAVNSSEECVMQVIRISESVTPTRIENDLSFRTFHVTPTFSWNLSAPSWRGRADWARSRWCEPLRAISFRPSTKSRAILEPIRTPYHLASAGVEPTPCHQFPSQMDRLKSSHNFTVNLLESRKFTFLTGSDISAKYSPKDVLLLPSGDSS